MVLCMGGMQTEGSTCKMILVKNRASADIVIYFPKRSAI
jgi:hypothetical protein